MILQAPPTCDEQTDAMGSHWRHPALTRNVRHRWPTLPTLEGWNPQANPLSAERMVLKVQLFSPKKTKKSVNQQNSWKQKNSFGNLVYESEKVMLGHWRLRCCFFPLFCCDLVFCVGWSPLGQPSNLKVLWKGGFTLMITSFADDVLFWW